MRKFYMAFLSTILAAGAVSLPLLASTTSAFAASPRTTAPIGTQLARLKAHAQPHAQPHGSVVSGVFFSPSSSVGGGSATWTIGLTTSASGALGSGTGTITIVAPTTTTFPSAAGDYSVNGTTVLVAPTTTAGTGTVIITTPVAVADSTAIPVVIVGVTNPAAASYPNTAFSVSTSADATPLNPAGGLNFGSVVSSVFFSPSSPVGGGSATWTIGLKTSASGALGSGTGTITIDAPTTTTFPSAAGDYSVNGTTVLVAPTTTAGTGTVIITTPVAVADSTAIPVVIVGVTNPAAASYLNTAFSVSTSADTAANPGSGQAFSVGSVNTTTGLGLSLTSVAYGSEASETFSVSVTGQVGEGYPEGTVAVYNSSTELCFATLYVISSDSSSATCSLAATQLATGPYSDVFATYTPGIPSSNLGYTYTTSTSYPVQAFSVGSVNTTTGLGLSLTSVAYGSEASETFTVSVTGQVGEGYPEGTVAVYNSTTELCIATLTFVSSYSSSATCSLAATQLAPASYSDVFATYTPGIPSSNLGYTYTTSTSYPVQAFSVIKYSTETTTTSLKLSAAQVTYGDEQVEQLSVSVSPQYAGTTPTGTVTISGANCQITLSSGKGSCTLPAAYFNAGNRQMVATYNGSSDFRHSASAKETITIATETTTTSLKLSAAQVTYGDEQVEQLSVSVSPQYAGTTPTGTVTISGANCQITLSSGKGSCTLPLAYFNVGNRKMVATYLGSSNFRHSASATQTIVIVK